MRTQLTRMALAAGCTAFVLAPLMATTAGAADIAGADGANAAHQTTGQYHSKGRPPPVGDAGLGPEPRVITSPEDGTFFYGMVSQDNVVADGARGYFLIEKPYLASGDFHSLTELAVQTTDQRQAIEVGWTVDRGLNGDDEPHLFVLHWVDGKRTCYTDCGFVPVANVQGYTAGMKLPVTKTPTQSSILHHGSVWLVGFNGHTFGYVPDSLWTTKFTLTGLVQWFGEVDAAVGVTTSCTEMGNGEFASSPTAARIENIGYAPARVELKPLDSAPTPALYRVLHQSFDDYRFGGPGAHCRSVPSLIGDTPLAATHRITAANLVVGTVGTVVDPLCEDLDHVVSQSPRRGRTSRSGAESTSCGRSRRPADAPSHPSRRERRDQSTLHRH